MNKLIATTIMLVSIAFAQSCDSSNKTTKDTTTKNKNDNTIVNKYWKLITLEGQKITMAKNQEREQYFMLKTEEQRAVGFAGCNNFSGTYTLADGGRIRFTQMAATMKACPDVAVDETAFLQIFEQANNYTINGDTLNLNVGRRAPLATFVAVYFE